MSNASVRTVQTALQDFDLFAEIQALETSPKRQAGRNSRTLIRNGTFRVVLVWLSEGAHVREHKTESPISIQVLTGSVRFETPQGSTVLSAGRFVVLERGLPHELEALEQSAFLLTLA